MRIGVLGGTFDPVHNGHIHIARHALNKLKLSKVIFVPVYIPPHKKLSGRSTSKDRLRMLRAALKGRPRFSILLYELKRKGKSYSIDTIRYMKRRFGSKSELFIIIGADSAEGLNEWKDIYLLRKLATFAVISRPGYDAVRCPLSTMNLNVPGKDISSTEIRMRVRYNESIRRLVPGGVAQYIEKNGIYK